MNVSAIIVTRGDHELSQIVASLPPAWEMLVWNNGLGVLTIWEPHTRDSCRAIDVPDLAVYGRYAAIKYASGDLIYVQDDDCVVSDPQAIVEAWLEADRACKEIRYGEPGVIANMPPEFRHEFYEDHALVGFGACFHRHVLARAFQKFDKWMRDDRGFGGDWSQIETDENGMLEIEILDEGFFYRACDIIFTMLTPRVLVDVPYVNLPHATDSSRMYRQREHVAERQRMRDLVRQVRDAV